MARSRSSTRGANATSKGKDPSTEKQSTRTGKRPPDLLHGRRRATRLLGFIAHFVLLPPATRARSCFRPRAAFFPAAIVTSFLSDGAVSKHATRDSLVPERIQPCQFESAVDRRRCALRTFHAAPIPGAPQSKCAKSPAGPSHPERTVRYAPEVRIRSRPRRSRREHRNGRTRPRMPSSWHRAYARRLGDARTHRPSHALRPHRSLQVRIEETPARRRGRATLQGRRHGDRHQRRRRLPGDRIRTVFPAPPHLALPPL